MKKCIKILVFLLLPLSSFAQDQKHARWHILQGNISEAIAEYSQLAVKANGNGGVLAEYALALALGGMPENALMYLDRANLLGGGADFPFYAAQVLSLMCLDSIAAEFWTEAGKTPEWIAPKYKELSQNHKSGVHYIEPDSAYIRANNLAARGMFFQSIMLYRLVQIEVEGCNNEFLPYLSSSVVWENLSKYAKAAAELKKSISLIKAELKVLPDTTLQNALPAFENHLTELQGKAAETQKLMSKIDKLQQTFKPQAMFYAGGMYSNKVFSLNSRFGFFLANSLNAAFDFGLSGGEDMFFVNTGLSAYYRYKFLMGGTGFNANIGKGGSFNWRLSAGTSFLNKEGKRSTDIFFNLDIPFKKGTAAIFSISIGQSIYFGKRGDNK
ncbi:MAG: hypothetical protein LBC98_06850 [Prevotellaceae bacterium]|jgi:tetratricopeptide (TPR) repeat protein|nr:hypothetical protein [Prevotellaceae bacterium]